MYGYTEAGIERRAAKRGQTVEEHLEYLASQRASRNERRREARKARQVVVDKAAKA
jgi:hypothetical protein